MKWLSGVLNNLFVSGYKAFGFVALLGILLGLAGYLILNVFFLFNFSWVAPLILTKTNEKVVQINSHLIGQEMARDKLKLEKLEHEAEANDLDRLIQINQAFQTRFDEALEADLVTQQIQLERIFQLRNELDQTHSQIQQSRESFKDFTKDRLEQERKAHLIGEEQYVQGRNMLANLEQSDLSLAEKKIKLENEASALRRAIRALKSTRDALGEGEAADEKKGLTKFDAASTDYSTLLKQKEYQRSVFELLRAAQRRDLMQQKLDIINRSIEGHQEIITALRDSPFYRAFHEQVPLGFVPYENLDNVKMGTPVYACAIEIFWCDEVGKVGRVLDGEVDMVHPLRNRRMRGVMAELVVDIEAAKQRSLHVGSKPFWF